MTRVGTALCFIVCPSTAAATGYVLSLFHPPTHPPIVRFSLPPISRRPPTHPPTPTQKPTNKQELRPFPLTSKDLLRSSSSSSSSTDAKRQQEEKDAQQDKETRWFARLLLEGKVLPEWSSLYTPDTTDSSLSSLNDPPALITHKRPIKKVYELIQPLLNAGVCTVGGLQKEWGKDPRFLKSAVKMWIRPERMGEFETLWKTTVGGGGGGKEKGKGKGN